MKVYVEKRYSFLTSRCKIVILYSKKGITVLKMKTKAMSAPRKKMQGINQEKTK